MVGQVAGAALAGYTASDLLEGVEEKSEQDDRPQPAPGHCREPARAGPAPTALRHTVTRVTHYCLLLSAPLARQWWVPDGCTWVVAMPGSQRVQSGPAIPVTQLHSERRELAATAAAAAAITRQGCCRLLQAAAGGGANLDAIPPRQAAGPPGQRWNRGEVWLSRHHPLLGVASPVQLPVLFTAGLAGRPAGWGSSLSATGCRRSSQHAAQLATGSQAPQSTVFAWSRESSRAA